MSDQTFGQIQLPSLGVKLLWLAFAIVMIILAWEGNTGKGLAAIISPRTLKVVPLVDNLLPGVS